MQRRGKHTSVTIENLLGNGVFYVVHAEMYKQLAVDRWRRSGAVQWSESVAMKRSLCGCYNFAILGVCSYSETLLVPILNSVTRKRLVENVKD
jgi:hypothetical protein